MRHYGDIRQLRGDKIEPVNVIIGGSPCQDLSIAGKGAGLKGNRSGLFLDQLRIIKEMREADASRGNGKIRPRFMVWENVPGAFSSNKGADFGTVLRGTVQIVAHKAPSIPVPQKGWPTAGCLSGMGDGNVPFSVAWRVLDAEFWGTPQRRRRIALVADFGGLSAPEILFERKSLQRDTKPGAKERKNASSRSEHGTGRNDSVLGRVGTEAAAFNGWKSVTGSIQYSHVCPCIESNMPPNVVLYESGAFKQDKSSDKKILLLNDQGGSSMNVEENAKFSPTLRAETHGNLPIICQEKASRSCASVYGIGNGQTNQNFDEDKAAPLNCMHDQQALLFPNNIVRRLTPLECERLQGFPDSWTDIGEWVDTKGKLHKNCSDTARYRALGNSIALPPWKYVLSRLSLYCDDDFTMGSLFDGIGGFPFIWEGLHGNGSCRWASEIEEFPVAVTKYHFEED